MAVFSDMNGFPESGFPVLANDNDMIVLNNLYWNPLKLSGFFIDVNGAVRFGAITCGAISATGIAAGGAISGATTFAGSGTMTLSSATAPLTISGAGAVIDIQGADATLIMTGSRGSIGNILRRIPKGFFQDLEIKNIPTVNGEPIALISDIRRELSRSVADGTYTVGKGTATDGTITITNGIITGIQEATNA